MATQTTGGGSTTSFTNTPQAGDDNYWYTEDALRDSSIYNVATKTLTLDVMSNDLGGNAKSLFSIDDGDGNAITSDFQLLCKDVNTSGCSPWEKTYDGNWIRINNGKIEFRIADPVFPNDPTKALDVNSLPAGQCIDDEFVYAIRLGNGTLSEATVRIHIAGQNDAATISGNAAGDVNEDGQLVTQGVLTVSDIDTGENKLVAQANAAGANGYGTFQVAEDGTWSYTLNNGLDAVQHLPAGATLTDTITVTSKDGTATQQIVVTIHGTNDGPDLGAVVDATINDTAADDTFAAINGTLTSTDADTGDTPTYSIDGAAPDASLTGFDHSKASAYGTLYINSSTGAYRFVPNDAAIEGLKASTSIDFEMRVTDGSGASDHDTLTITLNGANDTPAVANAIADQSINEDNAWLFQVPANAFSDRDLGETLTYSATLQGGGALPSWLSFDAGTRTFSGTPPQDFNGALNLTVTASDGGASTSDTFTLTINPVNDAPTATNLSAGESYTEDTPRNLTDIVVSDVDSANVTVTLTLSNIAAGALSTGTSGAVTSTYDAATGVWTASGAIADVNALLAGVTFNPAANFNGSFSIATSVSDGVAPAITGSKAMTGIPVNDAAVITGDTANSITEDAVPNTVSGNLDSTDVDGVNDSWNAVTTATSSANGYGKYTIDAAGNWVYTLDNTNSTVNALNDGGVLSDSFTVTTADGTSQVVSITINGHTDAPPSVAPTANNDRWVVSDLTTLPAGTITAAWFLNNDIDPDSLNLYVTNVTGLPAGMTANYDSFGHLVDITGATPAAGSFSLTYTMTDGTTSKTATVALTVVHTDANADTLDFNTTYNGTDFSYVDLLSGGDTVFGDTTLTGNAGKDIFIGNNGNDTLNGGGGDDRLFGNENIDTLNGDAGNDFLDGGNNDDTLNGGLGNDVLTGGAGRDKFEFSSSGAANADIVTDFDQSNNADMIGLSTTAFAAIGASLASDEFRSNVGGVAQDGNDFILFDTNTGNLYYDADGNGGGAKVLIATITLTGGANTFDQNDFYMI